MTLLVMTPDNLLIGSSSIDNDAFGSTSKSDVGILSTIDETLPSVDNGEDNESQGIRLSNGKTSWLVKEYDEPMGTVQSYLPMSSICYNKEEYNSKNNVISICICCDDMEVDKEHVSFSKALKRSIDSLKNQILPYDYQLDVLLLLFTCNENDDSDADNVSILSETTRDCLKQVIADSSDEELSERHDIFFKSFSTKATAHTVVVEPVGINENQDIRISFVIEKIAKDQLQTKNNHVVDSHMEWLSRHSQCTNSEYTMSMNCGNVLDGTHVVYDLVSRLQAKNDTVAVTGYYHQYCDPIEVNEHNTAYNTIEQQLQQSFVDPLGYFLLSRIQRVERDMRDDDSGDNMNSPRSVNSKINSCGGDDNATPMLQGPCGLYKTEAFIDLWS